MGQARSRGTYEERQAQAIARVRAQFPSSVKCNNCGVDLNVIEPMDVSGMPGMRLAGGAICSSCSHTTWVLDGTPDALVAVKKFLADESGEALKSGFALAPQKN